jgi:hypothetical protein
MADLNRRRRRWRGPALDGHLQRWARFCFAGNGGQATRILLAANSRFMAAANLALDVFFARGSRENLNGA